MTEPTPTLPASAGALLQPHAQPPGRPGHRLRHGLHAHPLLRRRVGAGCVRTRPRVARRRTDGRSTTSRSIPTPSRSASPSISISATSSRPPASATPCGPDTAAGRCRFASCRDTYYGTVVELSEERFEFMNTLFELSRASLFCQLVDLHDATPLPGHQLLRPPLSGHRQCARHGPHRRIAQGGDRGRARAASSTPTPDSSRRCRTNASPASSCC